jgi:SNF2 family DNA or RNA helicase
MSFSFYPGQFEYLARVATKDCALVAADTGCGKSLMALILIQLKLGTFDSLPTVGPVPPPGVPNSSLVTHNSSLLNGRALIVAPQGTLREDDDSETCTASQWRAEVDRFAPGVPVFELYSPDDYQTLMRRHGELPPGIYLTYYEALFRNGARETLPETWDHARLCRELHVPIGPTYRQFRIASGDASLIYHEDCVCGKPTERRIAPATVKVGDKLEGDAVLEIFEHPVANYAEGVGDERRGIRCIAAPSLATVIETGRQQCAFDLIALDEAHIIANLDAQVTQSLIRLQPKYRFAFTATPIPNVVSNLFSVMGWLSVPDWYLGNRRNAAWPYTRDELEKFNGTFLSEERDYTQEDMNGKRNPKWRGKCVKTSAVISSPARLLKLIKPTLAFISKPMCNANYRDPKIVDVRVPMGASQADLYRHFLNRGNISGSALVRARKQIQYLRAICADPAGFDYGGPRVTTNFNPKVIATMELIRDILGRQEQVVFISSRVGLTDTIARCLTEAGIPYARVDSTIPPSGHNAQANRFKRKEVPVMLMGMKCAASHSFSECPNEIIGAIEYSPGPFHQARGRVDRVNSLQPPTIYCLLTKATIEETMFDIAATKQDAATICLHGRRVPRDFKPVDMNEIIAQSIIQTQAQASTGSDNLKSALNNQPNALDETFCARQWRETLLPALRRAYTPANANPQPAPVKPATKPQPTRKSDNLPSEIGEPPVRRLPAWLTRLAQSKALAA